MAKKNLTLEEKLEEAIVKDGPYEVPGNWMWSKFGSVIQLISGRDVSATQCNDEHKGIPYILGASNIKDGAFIAERWIEKPVVIAKENDILLSCKGTIGKTIIINKEINISRQIMSIRCGENIELKYIKYFIDSYVNTLIEQSKGLIPGITREDVLSIKTPLPPLKEQQRIVDRIESLFEKLDNARKLIKEAREGFEKRKAAITSKAFRGALNQRNGNLDIKIDSVNNEIYKLPENWRWAKLKDVCEKITDGTHNSPQSYENGEYKYVTAKNIKEWGIDLSNITYLTKDDHDVIYKRCDVKYGDVLYIKDGATTGIATINEMDEEFSLLSSVALLRVNNYIFNRYLYYVLNSFEIKKIILESVKGVAITRLTLKKINDIIIPIPPIDEQKEIIKILDKLLEEESKIEELIKLEEQIELIKKSILAKAFRGELGTNCEEDESALELLKEILSKK